MTNGWHAAVIIPTRNNVEVVLETLSSLDCTTKSIPPGARCDVIVVDDSEPDQAARILAKCRAIGASYVSGPRTVAVKRNVGAQATSADYLIFVDSDCNVLDEGFVMAHVRRLQAGWTHSGRPLGAVAGHVRIRTDDSPKNFKLWSMAARSFSFQPQFEWPYWFDEVFWCSAGNLSLRREVFESIGRFHEKTYTVVGGEDVDICMRLQDAGFALGTAPDALAFHATAHITGVSELLSKMFRYGRSEVYSAMRQPHHQQFHLNPVSTILVAGLVGTRKPAAYVRRALAAASLFWAGHTLTLYLRDPDRDLASALFGVSMDWAFDAGIFWESLRRGVPRFAFQKFRYLDTSHFRPLTRGRKEA